MINPNFFIDKNKKLGFRINLKSHNNNHANLILSIIPHYPISELKQDILQNSWNKWLVFTLD